MEILFDSPTGGAAPAAASPLAASQGAGSIKDGTTATFARDVLEASMEVPVIVDFWAPWCGPCKQLGPMLEKLVRAHAGRVRMVKINVDENQDLAAQLRVQSVPMVYGFVKGQPIDGFAGAQPESQVKSFIARLLGGAASPLDEALDHAEGLLEQGDHHNAGQIFAEIQQADPANPRAIAGILRCSIAGGQLERARQIADNLPADLAEKTEIAAALSALDLAEQGREAAGRLGALEAAAAADPSDLQARFDLAAAYGACGRGEEAVDGLLSIIEANRTWNDEAARKQLLKLFEAFGPTDPLTLSGRRRLSSILFS